MERKVAFLAVCSLAFIFFMPGPVLPEGASQGSFDGYEKTHRESLYVGSLGKLRVSIHTGNTLITGARGKDLLITVKTRIRGLSGHEAGAMYDLLNFQTATENGEIILRTEIKGEGPGAQKLNELLRKGLFTTDLTLKVPEHMSVFYSSLKGDVVASGIRGGIRLSAMRGNIEIDGAMKSVRIYSIEGDFTGQNIEGPIEAKLYEGKIFLRGVKGRVRAENNRKNIYVNQVDGDVSARSVSGNITISGVRGNVKSSSVQGQIKIQSVTGSAQVRSQKGSIEVKNVILGEEDGVNLVSTDGNLRAFLPSTLSGNLKAETGTGIIRNDFEVRSPSGDLIKWKAHRSSLVGKVNDKRKGRNEIFLKTINGDIVLKKQMTR